MGRIEAFGSNDECVKVYDPEKKELIGIYNSYCNAAKKLGLTNRSVRDAAINKNRRYSPILKKEVAIRIAGKKENDRK